MDNIDQIREILSYRKYLYRSFGIFLNKETAAKLWILKYAAIWRDIQKRKIKGGKETTNYNDIQPFSNFLRQ